MKRGAWTAHEDKLLYDYIMSHGIGKWRSLPIKAGTHFVISFEPTSIHQWGDTVKRKLQWTRLCNRMLINIVQYFRCYCAVSIYMFSLPYVCVWTGAYIMYSGLSRCGKSCRLRWLNYLRPDIKRGNITEQEEDLIIRLHNLLGNRYHFWFSFFILLSNYENKIWYQQYNATFIKLTDQSYI